MSAGVGSSEIEIVSAIIPAAATCTTTSSPVISVVLSVKVNKEPEREGADAIFAPGPVVAPLLLYTVTSDAAMSEAKN